MNIMSHKSSQGQAQVEVNPANSTIKLHTNNRTGN
uniref:Uncharacterized protein n=1 Tax=Anguilla anguilla TaxID=7936 RepID=A0A0E9PP50_ANGAN